MLVTNHVLAGALIGTKARGPATAFGVGFASHFVMDALPHWGDESWERFLPVAVVDGLVGAATTAVVARMSPRGRRTRVVAGMLGAAFPDADKPGVLFFGTSPFPDAFDRFHLGIQHESRSRMPQEMVVAAAGAACLLAVRLRRR